VQSLNNFLQVPENVRLKNSAKKSPVRQTGFIAQEVEAIVKKSGFVFSGVDAPENEKDHYSIRYSEFVVPLVQAVQELDKKIEKLEELVSSQQKLITALLSSSPENSNEKTGIKLYQNHPNPFTSSTEITMDIAGETKEATIFIYDLNGEMLERISVQGRGTGVSIKLDGGKLSSGIYFYSLVVDGTIIGVKRMILTN